MPIRPEYRWLYRIDWKQLSAVIRFEWAKGRCQGCGRPHGRIVCHLGDGRWWDAERQAWRDGEGSTEARTASAQSEPDEVDAHGCDQRHQGSEGNMAPMLEPILIHWSPPFRGGSPPASWRMQGEEPAAPFSRGLVKGAPPRERTPIAQTQEAPLCRSETGGNGL
jgi:hypothetical protein